MLGFPKPCLFLYIPGFGKNLVSVVVRCGVARNTNTVFLVDVIGIVLAVKNTMIVNPASGICRIMLVVITKISV